MHKSNYYGCSTCTNGISECNDKDNVPCYWPLTAKVTVEKEGEVQQEIVENIRNGKFVIPQQYAFPVNTEQAGESITVIRMEIPAGTGVEEGYREIRHTLDVMGLDVDEVCTALQFTEIIGAPF